MPVFLPGEFHGQRSLVGCTVHGLTKSQTQLSDSHFHCHCHYWGGSVVKNPPTNAGDLGYSCLIPGSGKIPWRRAWQPTPVFLPGESHGQRSLEGYTVHRVTKSWTQLKWLSMHPLPFLTLLFYIWISKHWLSSNSQCTNTERKTKASVRYLLQVSNQQRKSVRWVEKR